ncbi:MAG: tetratricopeptide repeat protein [Desulfobacterales bacterium]|nr:tetratricopeptide repeat protein [Desulfobacterales bacterium]MCP4162535.1 tetratricopeptide repeat protein [Deltaproteobacteria bacterium]
MKFLKTTLYLFIVFFCGYLYAGPNIQNYEQAVLEKPDSSNAHLALGRAYQHDNKPFKAIKSLKKAIDLDYGNETAHIFLGELYYNKGQFDLASMHYEKALKINGCAAYYNYYGNALTKNEKLTLAIKSYKKAISLDPDNPLFYYGLGYVYRKTGKFKEYKKISLKLLKLDKDFGNKLKNDSELFAGKSSISIKFVKEKRTNNND